MLLKVFILSIILVTLIMLVLSLKLFFDPEAEFSAHSCAFEDGDPEKDLSCVGCKIKDLTDCAEDKK